MQEFQGAFPPYTFWLAANYAQMGQPQKVEAILDRVDAIAGEFGLFEEEIEPLTQEYHGSTP